MGLFDKLSSQFIDIIQWLDDSRDTIVYRFPRADSEIKNGAQLIVRESQAAVFVNEGKVADAFGPGTYTLTTQNLPILSDLKGWKYGFNSPFKADVYFVNMRQFTDLKWGTQNPIMLRDPEFGMVRLRAFGGYAMRVVDPPKLLSELVGTDPQFRTEEVEGYIRQLIVSKLAGALATSGVSALDLAAHQQDIGLKLAAVLSEDMSMMGITIPQLIIENISLPPEVEAAMDKRTQMGVIGNLDQYTKFQTATAIGDAANNPGGAGEGMGLGMGMAMGQAMANSMRGDQSGGAAPAAPAGPPPMPAAKQWYVGVNGQQSGPMAGPDLAAQIRSGAVPGDALVWTSGMAEWKPASEVPEMTALLGALPPALPPQQ